MEVVNLVVCAALVLGFFALFLLPERDRLPPPTRPGTRERRDAPIPRHSLTPRRRTPDDNN